MNALFTSTLPISGVLVHSPDSIDLSSVTFLEGSRKQEAKPHIGRVNRVQTPWEPETRSLASGSWLLILPRRSLASCLIGFHEKGAF